MSVKIVTHKRPLLVVLVEIKFVYCCDDGLHDSKAFDGAILDEWRGIGGVAF